MPAINSTTEAYPESMQPEFQETIPAGTMLLFETLWTLVNVIFSLANIMPIKDLVMECPKEDAFVAVQVRYIPT